MTDRDRVKLLVIGPVPPPYTGTEVMTALMLRSSLRQHFDLVHFNTSRNRPVSTKGQFDLLNLYWGIRHLFTIAFLLVRYRPRLFFLPFAQNKAAGFRDGLFVLLARLSGAHIVAMFHNAGFRLFFDRLSPIWKLYFKHVLAHIDRPVVLAYRLKEQFRGLIDPSMISVCYNAVDCSQFPLRLARSAPEAERPQVGLLFMGYLSKAKGAYDLVQAFNLIADQRPALRLLLAGGRLEKERNVTYVETSMDDQEECPIDLIKRRFPGRVVELGIVTGQEKIDLFLSADIFVLPSYSEAFPVVVLEAMAVGLPLITSPVGALGEVLKSEENALFVDPGNIHQLAQALLRLADSPDLRRRMGENNRNLVAREFDMESYALRLRDIFSTLT